MHDLEKSDRLVVPAKPPNNPGGPGAEVVEGRGLPEGNTASETRTGLSVGERVSSDLGRVRRVARKDGDVRFTALLHHVTVDRLREAYRADHRRVADIAACREAATRRGLTPSPNRKNGPGQTATFRACSPNVA